MQRKYWAKRGKKTAGPCDTREDVLSVFRAHYPFNGPDYQAQAKRNQIMTGYGVDGPYFDLRWHDARECN